MHLLASLDSAIVFIGGMIKDFFAIEFPGTGISVGLLGLSVLAIVNLVLILKRWVFEAK